MVYTTWRRQPSARDSGEKSRDEFGAGRRGTHRLATKPWIILRVGCVFAVVHSAVSRFAIIKFDIKTPGRDDDADELEAANTKD